MLTADMKKGSAELLVMSMIEDRARHGYDIARLIEERSQSAIVVNSATLYPTLHALERQGLIRGRWVAVAGDRRRRYYSITAAGRRMLADQRGRWQQFFAVLSRVARL